MPKEKEQSLGQQHLPTWRNLFSFPPASNSHKTCTSILTISICECSGKEKERIRWREKIQKWEKLLHTE